MRLPPAVVTALVDGEWPKWVLSCLHGRCGLSDLDGTEIGSWLINGPPLNKAVTQPGNQEE